MDLSSMGLSVSSSTAVQSSLNFSSTATNVDAPPAVSTLGSLVAVLLTIFQLLPTLLYWTVTFASITLPTWLFTLFSTSLTFTLNFTTIALIVLVIASTVSWFIRYNLMGVSTRLPPEPQRKQPQVDLFPDSNEEDSKPGLSNYLDEFLSAIKVFGYLERPVFHELTRTMQTKKLIAGETLLLEEEQGFCLVVDGLVQIFVKSNRPNESLNSSGGEPSDALEDDEDRYSGLRQGYQLLTEVKNGAPMSSLFSILSLFTEDVKLRYDDDRELGDSRPPSAGPGTSMYPNTISSLAEALGPVSHSASPSVIPSSSPRTNLKHRGSSTLHDNEADGPVPPLSLDSNQGDALNRGQKHVAYSQRPMQRRMMSAHPDIVARATVDTTIAVIPATAFRRLTRVYPRASAHIVQVILSRLQRVTLTTGHAYLGLTSEVLRTERLMNRYTTYDLPGFLRGSALERLKEKFSKERERIGFEESAKGIALHNPRPVRRRRSSSGLRKEAVEHARLAAVRSVSPNRVKGGSNIQMASPIDDRHGVNAGDLLTNGHLQRGILKQHQLGFSQPFQTRSRGSLSNGQGDQNRFASSARNVIGIRRQDSQDEDMIFRESILECMLKVIGLTNSKSVLPKMDSVEQSPRLVSYDSKRQKAVFNNAFGFMDPFDISADGDSESISSVPMSTTSQNNPQSIQDELSGDVEIVFFPKDAVLVEQGEKNPGLYYVIDGFLDVSVPMEEASSDANILGTSPRPMDSSVPDLVSKTATPKRLMKRTYTGSSKDRVKTQGRKTLYLTKPGGVAGYLATVSSRKSFVDVTAKTDVYVGFLPRASIERILEKYPIVLLTMAKRLTSLLPRVILHIDFALEWVQVDAGQAIYHQGEESDAIYIVLNGRLRSLSKGQDGKMQVTGEYGQGDSVGELEVLTESPRPGALHAIRDTELAKLPKTLFNSLSLENPEITLKISKTIATRLRDLMDNPIHEGTKDRGAKPATGVASSNINLRTVAILPVTADTPVVEFSSRLLSALTQIGTPNGVTSLNQATILNHLGRHAFSRMGRLKLSQHLADLEEKYGLVLYVADTNVNSPWTLTCISQADCILLVGLAEGSPSIGEYERLLLTTKTTARKELVLLHAERYCPPGLTRRWLSNRTWITGSHHHIHMAFRNTTEPVHAQTRRFGSVLKQRVQVLQAEIQKYTSRRVRQTPLYSADTPFKGDFHRLGRRLIGKSVGLVLGGGGARGIAHIGIIRALEEAGIPIDIVGGTSIGAFVGALYAWDADVVPMYGRAKKFAGRMGSMWRFALDLTYPSAAYTTGNEFNRGIFKTFGTAQIEDFWLEFYCNTTNISKSQPEFHTSGHVWRYVRASMSLAGLVPPVCDDGFMLLDGGYLDNLTVAHMKSLGADVMFAIDVGSIDDIRPQQFGDSLSGFWSIVNRWNPFSTYANPPTLSDIQARLAYVSSVDALERAKTMPGCRYMRPPVVDYGTLEFAKFEEIYQVGYRYGKEYLNGLRDEGVLPVMEDTEEKRNLRRTMAPRRASI